jgi:hypothetical protein
VVDIVRLRPPGRPLGVPADNGAENKILGEVELEFMVSVRAGRGRGLGPWPSLRRRAWVEGPAWGYEESSYASASSYTREGVGG